MAKFFMQDILRKAKKPIISLMLGRCDIKEYQSVTDPKTHITKQELVTVYSNQQCKLSYTKNPTATEGDATGTLLAVRLLLPSELDIKAGNVFIVTQAGKTQEYKAASAPAVYTNHQEVELESVDEYA